MMFRGVFFSCFLLLLSGKAESGEFGNMESSQAAANQRASSTLVAYMSLEVMFPDEKVRLLADAAGKGDVELVGALAAKGIDVNSKGTNNATPLFWAMHNFKGYLKLLDLGADPNIIIEGGGSVIHWAVRNRDKRFLLEALKHGGNPNLVAGQFNETPLFKAAGPEGKDNADVLLDAGADINAQKLSGDTVIMVAAKLGQFDLVYKLLERGADFTITNKQGNNLLDIIEFRKRTMAQNNDLTQWMSKVITWLNEHNVRQSRATNGRVNP